MAASAAPKSLKLTKEKIMLSKMCDQCKGYDDTIEKVKSCFRSNGVLTQEERTNLAAAYKNAVATRRQALKLISQSQWKELVAQNPGELVFYKEYKQRIETELEALGSSFLTLLEEDLLPSAVTPDVKVFYCNLKGDHFRYMAEIAQGGARDEAARSSALAYKAGLKIAVALPPAHPARLRISLNHCVLQHEILGAHVEACKEMFGVIRAAVRDAQTLQQLAQSETVLKALRASYNGWIKTLSEADRQQLTLAGVPLSAEAADALPADAPTDQQAAADPLHVARELVKRHVELEARERNTFAVACKTAIDTRRHSLRKLQRRLRKLDPQSADAPALQQRVHKAEELVSKMCRNVQQMVDEDLIPFSEQQDAIVFYCNIKADYQRYLCEVLTDDERKAAIDQAQELYADGWEIATKELSAAHPVRLGLLLNYCVFLDEVAENAETAYHLAAEGLEAASAVADRTPDADRILHMIRQNFPSDAAERSANEEDAQDQAEEQSADPKPKPVVPPLALDKLNKDTPSATSSAVTQHTVLDEKYQRKAKEYDGLIKQIIRSLQEADEIITPEKRSMLAQAFKSAVDVRRTARRAIASRLSKIGADAEGKRLLTEQQQKVESELMGICKLLTGAVDECLLPSATTSEGKVFCYNIKGDYARYVAESTVGDVKLAHAKIALASYQSGWDIACSDLPSAHPARLGVAFNFSVFFDEVIQAPIQAAEVAKAALHEAEMDSTNRDRYKESAMVVRMLKDNLRHWEQGKLRDGRTPQLTPDIQELMMHHAANGIQRAKQLSTPPPVVIPFDHDAFQHDVACADEVYSEHKKRLRPNCDLSDTDRSALATAFKSALDLRRMGYRKLQQLAVGLQHQRKFDDAGVAVVAKDRVEGELIAMCHEMIDILNKQLIPCAASTRAKVFYFNLQGDYYRYLAEVQSGDAKKQSADSCCESYSKGLELAQRELPAANASRLSIVLNLSVYYDEIFGDTAKAIELCQQAIADAEADPSLTKNTNAQKVLGWLKDNLAGWSKSTNTSSATDVSGTAPPARSIAMRRESLIPPSTPAHTTVSHEHVSNGIHHSMMSANAATSAGPRPHRHRLLNATNANFRSSVAAVKTLAVRKQDLDAQFEQLRKHAIEHPDLTESQRTILAAAFKHALDVRRSTIRKLNEAQWVPLAKNDTAELTNIKADKTQIEGDIVNLCHGMVQLLDNVLIPAAASPTAKTFYYNLKGDYLRYVAECQTRTSENALASQYSLDAYTEGWKIAEDELPAGHPTRLGLVLNLSVFYHEILNRTDKAISFAATQVALAENDDGTRAQHKDSNVILGWVRENLRNWQAGKRRRNASARVLAQLGTEMPRSEHYQGTDLSNEIVFATKQLNDCMSELLLQVRSGQIPTEQQRARVARLLAVAVEVRSAAAHALSDGKWKQAISANDSQAHDILETRLTLRKEVIAMCKDVIKAVDTVLLPACNEMHDSRAHFMMFKASALRWLADSHSGPKREKFAADAVHVFSEASKLCEQHLSATSMIRLQCAHDMAMAFSEFLEDRTEAIRVLQSAVQAIPTGSSVSYDVRLIVSSMKGTLAEWREVEEQKAKAAAPPVVVEPPKPSSKDYEPLFAVLLGLAIVLDASAAVEEPGRVSRPLSAASSFVQGHMAQGSAAASPYPTERAPPSSPFIATRSSASPSPYLAPTAMAGQMSASEVSAVFPAMQRALSPAPPRSNMWGSARSDIMPAKVDADDDEADFLF